MIGYGFDEDDFIVVHPEHLDKIIGPETEAYEKMIADTETVLMIDASVLPRHY